MAQAVPLRSGNEEGYPNQIDSSNRPTANWNRELFDTRRPYERKNYDVPFRPLPNYLAPFGGLNVRPRKCAPPSAFSRRTPIEEVFHKRNPATACRSRLREPLPALERCVDEVIVAGNLSSGESRSNTGGSDEEIDATENRRGSVSKECYRTFFRARKALLRSELFEEYFTRAPTTTSTEHTEVSDVSEDEQELPTGGDLSSAREWKPADSSFEGPIESSYEMPTIVHRENKPQAIEAQDAFFNRLRIHYLEKFERVHRELEEADRQRRKPPEPFDEEKYLAEYPPIDIKNEAKVRFRQSLARRLDELNQQQQRPVRVYPKTVEQFAEYKAELLENKRKLRDEAFLVADHFRKANTPKEIPETRLELQRFRVADFGPDPDRESETDGDEDKPAAVYATCMTRAEWGNWIARSAKVERLKLPKVKLSSGRAVVLEKCLESPIRAYIEGRVEKTDVTMTSGNQPRRRAKGSLRPKKIIPSTGTTMRDLLFDPMMPDEPETTAYIPYTANLRPYSDIIEERFRADEGRQQRRRRLRKSRMRWIEELVDEICRRRRC
ncbi:uncharacterized protein LOC131215155 [Anopheles bellator]|uniref:uncharacterized protein LOC131215155 n=1 Tax=Anopheles bellator TaxID=139047 RepID=UPI0026483665|nr:uncharacterized protein LOC131215155 [Anopheles bellator]